jgi:glycosyltransferase involved in cell wall biosynthesis
MRPQIDILLATYNGQDYLVEQLESIINQTFDDWRIIVRDDGSSDSTLEIIREYLTQYPERFEVLEDDSGRLGACASYSILLQYSTAPYIAFCDQDDVWQPDKLEIQIRAMQGAEPTLPHGVPVLVHTDMIVVDEDLNELSGSLWKYQNMSPEVMATLQRSLIQNHVTACATMINRNLADLCVPIPAAARMHDWWIALVAVIYGKIVIIRKATLIYRQHDTNDTGAKKWGWRYVMRLFLSGRTMVKNDLLRTRDQALELLSHPMLDQSARNLIQHYVHLYELGWFRKRYMLIKYGYFKYGLIRNIGLFLFI